MHMQLILILTLTLARADICCLVASSDCIMHLIPNTKALPVLCTYSYEANVNKESF
jgi:hypothetical protein